MKEFDADAVEDEIDSDRDAGYAVVVDNDNEDLVEVVKELVIDEIATVDIPVLAESGKVVEYNGDVDLKEDVLAEPTSKVVKVVVVSSLVAVDELELFNPVVFDDVETDDD